MEINTEFMREAVRLAEKAALEGEVPVGAVIVYKGEIIASAYNTRERDKCAVSHAEIRAIERACEKRGGWRLFDCVMYVTLEPCLMCAGAAINARLDGIVFGAHDARFGALGGNSNVSDYDSNHKMEVEGGVLEEECASLLSEFFKSRRKNNI